MTNLIKNIFCDWNVQEWKIKTVALTYISQILLCTFKNVPWYLTLRGLCVVVFFLQLNVKKKKNGRMHQEVSANSLALFLFIFFYVWINHVCVKQVNYPSSTPGVHNVVCSKSNKRLCVCWLDVGGGLILSNCDPLGARQCHGLAGGRIRIFSIVFELF